MTPLEVYAIVVIPQLIYLLYLINRIGKNFSEINTNYKSSSLNTLSREDRVLNYKKASGKRGK